MNDRFPRDIELFTSRHGDPQKHLAARAAEAKAAAAGKASGASKRSHSPSPASSVGKQAKLPPEPSKLPQPAESKEPQPKKKEDELLIATLRLLSALEDVLDDLGPQIYTCLGRANSLEVNRGAGSSMGLVDDPSVYRCAAFP